MHWLGRGTIAVASGGAYGILIGLDPSLGHFHERLHNLIEHSFDPRPLSQDVAFSVAYCVPTILIAFLVFGCLTYCSPAVSPEYAIRKVSTYWSRVLPYGAV